MSENSILPLSVIDIQVRLAKHKNHLHERKGKNTRYERPICKRYSILKDNYQYDQGLR